MGVQNSFEENCMIFQYRSSDLARSLQPGFEIHVVKGYGTSNFLDFLDSDQITSRHPASPRQNSSESAIRELYPFE
jgi:hypothetical protein